MWRSFHRKLWWQWWCQWEYCLLSPSILILSTVITIACDCIYEREQVEVSDTPWNYCIAFHANRFVVLSSSWAGGTAIYTCVHTLSCFLKLIATVHVGMSIKHSPDICGDADPCSAHGGGHLASDRCPSCREHSSQDNIETELTECIISVAERHRYKSDFQQHSTNFQAVTAESCLRP